MAAVTLRHIAKRFGAVVVIEKLDLEIRDHEFMVLVGPSGCGKSTALRMIAGLEEISGGEMLIGDRVVNADPPKDRDIAMVFQSYALYPHMTVRQNLDFGLRIRKTPAAEIEKLVNEAAQVLGIDALLDRKPKQLSGGQRQRVALGRAIVRKPAVFLFDEPLSNLDAKLRVQMRAEIKRLQQRLGTTTIYVTHDQIEAMTMGHRIAVLKDGKLQQVGTPLEVYEQPRNLFVAQFIGSPPMNFLSARIDPGGKSLTGAAFAVPVPAAWQAAAAAAAGRQVSVGVRPEHVLGPERSPRAASARLDLAVEIVETLGDELVVHGRIGEDLLVWKQDPHHPPAVGEKVQVQLELDALHLFDTQSQQRLGA